MKTKMEIRRTERLRSSQENENGSLTKAALAACDAAGVASSPPSHLVEIHHRLQNALACRKQDFSEWIDQNRGTRNELKEEFFERWAKENGRRPKFRECVWMAFTGAVGKFIVDETRHYPPESRFFLDEPWTVLRHISIPDGFRLECSFEDLSDGGYSNVFATKGDLAIPLENALELDGTPESFWEAHILRFEAAQFYLFWHSNYAKRFMVYDLRDFLSIYRFGRNETGGTMFDRLTEDEQSRLLKMDFTPILTPKADGADICCTEFSPFHGFFRRQYSLAREKSGLVISSTDLERINYNCGIVF